MRLGPSGILGQRLRSTVGVSRIPACYGKGGELPTTTDANVVLGYLAPGFFAGGKMQLDADAAREAVARSGLDVTVIDPQPFLCDGQTYRATIDGTKMHTDGVHFTKEGARLFWEWLGPRLLNAGRTTGATPSAPAP